MGFFTIYASDGLTEAQYEMALRAGPSLVSTRRRAHQDLLAAAGFTDIEEVHLTAAFLTTARAWIEGRDRYAAELKAAEGDAAFEDRRSDSLALLDAIEAGVLRRSLFICSVPGRRPT